jgi:hypothetical protein
MVGKLFQEVRIQLLKYGIKIYFILTNLFLDMVINSSKIKNNQISGVFFVVDKFQRSYEHK